MEVKGKACTSNAGLEVDIGGHDVAGSGGGGGSGGCAGAGGKGGSGGGGSFGVFVAFENAPASIPLIYSNEVQRGFGAAGGSGGGGGAGGERSGEKPPVNQALDSIMDMAVQLPALRKIGEELGVSFEDGMSGVVDDGRRSSSDDKA